MSQHLPTPLPAPQLHAHTLPALFRFWLPDRSDPSRRDRPPFQHPGERHAQTATRFSGDNLPTSHGGTLGARPITSVGSGRPAPQPSARDRSRTHSPLSPTRAAIHDRRVPADGVLLRTTAPVRHIPRRYRTYSERKEAQSLK